MVEGVQADLVALVDHAPHQVGVARGHGAGDEEHREGAVLVEHVQDLGGPLRVRAVVEGEDQTVVPQAQALGTAAAGVDDRAALQDPLRHPVGGAGRPYAVVGQDLVVDIAVQHQHRHQGDEGERGQQQAHGETAA
ncbi:hypothetical protein AQI70_32920 [Streptomyces curacoi]|uniref:Uncharacterized protein n=1 Tax=Streptomyces curacoi TaxID=146536 RepID=A0A117NWN3_9ACTN|nr:hypothetical protein AQI70_32920 [Streptomyces curacoi]